VLLSRSAPAVENPANDIGIEWFLLSSSAPLR
jgi:hypothetical protein